MALVVGFAATGAAAEQVCVEEAAGVCLKYRTVAPKKAVPVKPVKPAGPTFENTPDAQVEEGLNLNRNEYRFVQSGLQKAGFYKGGIDGVMGGGLRKALAAWQAANGVQATGYLTFEQVVALQEGESLASSNGVDREIDSGSGNQNLERSSIDLPAIGDERNYVYSNPESLEGGDITVSATRVSETTIDLVVSLSGALKGLHDFRKRCETPLQGNFNCEIFASGRVWQVSGEYPKIVLDGKSILMW